MMCLAKYSWFSRTFMAQVKTYCYFNIIERAANGNM